MQNPKEQLESLRAERQARTERIGQEAPARGQMSHNTYKRLLAGYYTEKNFALLEPINRRISAILNEHPELRPRKVITHKQRQMVRELAAEDVRREEIILSMQKDGFSQDEIDEELNREGCFDDFGNEIV